MELGYHVTLVTDATAAFSEEAMHAAHVINGPTFVSSGGHDDRARGALGI
jgi:nicotinamidase-related amidase